LDRSGWRSNPTSTGRSPGVYDAFLNPNSRGSMDTASIAARAVDYITWDPNISPEERSMFRAGAESVLASTIRQVSQAAYNAPTVTEAIQRSPF